MSTHAWVAGNSHQKSGEDHADTDTGTTEANGCRAHTEVLGDLDHGGSDFRGEGTCGLTAHDVAGGMVEDGGGLLTLEGLECVGSEVVGDTYFFLMVRTNSRPIGCGIRWYVPENARWEEPLALKVLRTTGRATFAEVEPMREATFGANMRAAILYEEWRCL